MTPNIGTYVSDSKSIKINCVLLLLTKIGKEVLFIYLIKKNIIEKISKCLEPPWPIKFAFVSISSEY